MSTGNTTRAGTPVYEYTIDLAKIVKDTFTHSDTKRVESCATQLRTTTELYHYV